MAILAGGRGERVGGEKPSLELAGSPLIAYPTSAAIQTGGEVVVLAKPDTALPPLEARILREPAQPQPPLCGIVAGLREAVKPVLAMGCDLPFVTSELIAWMAGLPHRLVIPVSEGSARDPRARATSGLGRRTARVRRPAAAALQCEHAR